MAEHGVGNIFSPNYKNLKEAPLWPTLVHVTTMVPFTFAREPGGLDICGIPSDSFEDMRVEKLKRACYKRSKKYWGNYFI